MSHEQLAIVGGGVIACGIAAVAARSSNVVLWVRSDASAERAERQVAKNCAKLGSSNDTASVIVTTAIEEIEDRTFVIEAVAEDLQVKCDVLTRLGAQMQPNAVIGTTTSSLDVEVLASATGRPMRFVGFHVFNPVARMQLVELAFPEMAAADTRARAHALAISLEKEPIQVPNSAGFVVNRLLFPYLFDAVRLADESGMAPADVDTCMTRGAGHPMGPLALLDYVGLDVAVAIGDALQIDVPPILRRLVTEGAFGRKTKQGLYQYEDAAG